MDTGVISKDPEAIEPASSFLWGGTPNTTKAIDIISKADIYIARIFIIAVAGATVLIAKFPRTAANHFGFAVLRSSGVFLMILLIIVYLIEIIAPLPYVAAHVIQSPRVGPLLAYRVGVSAGVLVKPGIVSQF